MSAGTAASGRGRAAWLIIGLGCWLITGTALWAQPMDDFKANTMVASGILKYVPLAPEISCLEFNYPSVFSFPTRIALRYFHPFVQYLTFSQEWAGPEGRVLLPDNREFNSELLFTIHLGEERRLLTPEAKGISLTVVVSPGRIKEEWIWPDGLVVHRFCFQSPEIPAIGVRYVVHNLGANALRGLRLEACLLDPEIKERSAKATLSQEEDDQIFTDPRTGTLYQRDYLSREESWIATGWSPIGGLIKAGEVSELVAAETLGKAGGHPMPGLLVSIETPAQDLEPGQFTKAIYWMTWGSDRETVSQALAQLQQQAGYYFWEEKVKANAEKGLKFICSDPNLTFIFQMLKAWAPWLVIKDNSGQVFFSSIFDNRFSSPEKLAPSIYGLIALGKHKAVKQYLDYCLDQRLETPDMAYTLIAAYRYYLFTHDQVWLRDNAMCLQEAFQFLADLDQDQDGLPDFHRPSGQISKMESAYSEKERTSDEPIQFIMPLLASIMAFRCGAELFAALNPEDTLGLAKRYRLLAEKAETLLSTYYWDPQLGSKGYYALGRLKGKKLVMAHCGITAADVILNRIGPAANQEAVFQELWTNPAWRTARGQYLILPADDSSFDNANIIFDQSLIDYQHTHDILLAGLLRPKMASEALDRLLYYSSQLILDQENMGQIGNNTEQKASGLDLSSLNLIELILRGLCGLEFSLAGLQIHMPEYNQALDVKLQGFVFQGCRMNVQVRCLDKGKSQITVNGKKYNSGEIIPSQSLANTSLDIIITKKIKKPEKKPAH